MITVWVFLNEKFCRWFRWIQIDQQLPDTLPSRSQWWLIASNHQSWADIVILQIVFRKLAPPIKFFTKRELIWVPFLGFGLWLLRFPYVRRRRRDSGNFQHKQRQKTQQELARAASQFHERPIALLLFLEGTRFTPEKHVDQCPPYQYLLRPKLGGLTFTLDTLASKLIVWSTLRLATMGRYLDSGIFYVEGARRSLSELKQFRLLQISFTI